MTLAEMLSAVRDKTVIVVGDLMLDEYIFGSATRISQEAPVMVVRKSSTRVVPGGAANVAKNVLAMGGVPSLIGVVGDDEGGQVLVRSLEDAGIRDAIVIPDPVRPTTRKTRILADAAHQVLRIDEESSDPVSEAVETQIGLRLAHRIHRGADALLFSDYVKGTLTKGTIQRVTQGGLTMPVVANAKPHSLPLYRGATLVSLNRPEAEEAIGRNLETLSAAREASREIADRYGIEQVLVTMGSRGMALADADAPPVPVEVFDTAGAGDTVIATMTLALAAGITAADAIQLASHTAAAVVRKVGVAVPTSDDLARIGGYPS